VIRAKGMDEQDRHLRTAIAYRLVQALNRQALRGGIGSAGKRGGVRVWTTCQVA
jgi:hypothetical protein